jgi:pyrrolidone-carboxylate peptidase
VKFHRAQFIKAVEKYQPDTILGLGQCSRGRHLRIESRAVNKRRSNKSAKARRISAGGARRMPTNLKLDLGREARVSRSAGDYVCNYSMYVILEYIRQRRFSIRFGFIHVPHGYSAKTAVRILTEVVGGLRATIYSSSESVSAFNRR